MRVARRFNSRNAELRPASPRRGRLSFLPTEKPAIEPGTKSQKLRAKSQEPRAFSSQLAASSYSPRHKLLQPQQLFANFDFSVPRILAERVAFAGKDQESGRHALTVERAFQEIILADGDAHVVGAGHDMRRRGYLAE